ncbi:aspartate-semialdehyde dehydrogenase [Thermanaerovibrio velox DSM 12556]|uniref:Aspartate-semialdehyde dehydrogenase n=1 Tax=Thermanaerovibrio velox DSM 12556 TaxID=926567 RepID=H0UQD3_9BACT|nr:aspartate-semialdehyde dehydrogenase [Thermanaerovibrio velox]EHM09687.1 aspartate-semialdehyde dehydrogenase [Thermanaerovibrio velox DSM 12556]
MKVAVLGATGLVGGRMLECLERSSLPVDQVLPLGSERSRGRAVIFRGEELEVLPVEERHFEGVSLALFSAGSGPSKAWAPVAASKGAVVVDNSSAWRMDPQVPLVVPEINAADLAWHRGIVANPNCATIQALMVLYPLHRRYGLCYFSAVTYQSVSGTGRGAVEELKGASAAYLAGQPWESSVYPRDIAFNLLPHIGSFDDQGISEEEWKMVRESRKILGMPHLKVSSATVRVPTFNCHGEAISASFEEKPDPREAREILAGFKGVEVMDDPKGAVYPTPHDGAGRGEVLVGRIRPDTGLENGLAMWVVADNLLKGAALNAVQIGEALFSGGARV